ncbi:MAG: glutaminyl-peptide cyclotransferase, partial [Lacibacter sp.]
MKPIYSLLLIFTLAACGNDPDKDDSSAIETIPAPAQISYSLLKVYPHDTSAYTQGLQFVNGFLYEGTGNPDSVPNKSKLRKVDYSSG